MIFHKPYIYIITIKDMKTNVREQITEKLQRLRELLRNDLETAERNGWIEIDGFAQMMGNDKTRLRLSDYKIKERVALIEKIENLDKTITDLETGLRAWMASYAYFQHL